MSEERYRLPYIRLLPGQDDDLIAWLATLEGEPHGVRGQHYKQIVREGLRVCGGLPWSGSGHGPVPPATPLDTEALLGDIRRVMEAVLKTALARGTVLVTSTDAGGAAAVQDVGDWLEDMRGGLLLGEDDG
ncbi:MAG: hypothetical protein H0T73_15060 [Ardenticatenales bacterium]|nr:hypothetical protein [Ardenticatenales bacterium]